MAKSTVRRNSTVADKNVLRKRKIEDDGSAQSEQESDIELDGLIDDEISEDEDDDVEEEEDEVHRGDVDSDADSDAELNRLLADEDDEEDESDLESSESEEEEPVESASLVDKFTNVHIRTLSDNSESGGKISEFSDGSKRVIKPEIDPVYESDDSDAENFNTIGNIPLSAYEEMPHIGYDVNGKRIMRPARGSALDQLLESIDLPEGWTGLLDSNTGSSLNLSKEEIELIDKIENNRTTDESVNPYEPTIEWFTSKPEIMPLTAVPEPKRRFVPSKHEAKRIMKIVKAIREGRIVPKDKVKKDEAEEELSYDLWGDNSESSDHIMTLRAPKLAPPGNDESYNPPEEYLLTPEELSKHEGLDPIDRERNFVPQKFDSLRKVPGYEENIRERFERSLDLYLAPRVRKNKLNIDPESLIPELPSPKDLRPFPIRSSTIYEGHTDRIRSVSVDPTGLWLATGSDDGTVKIWEVLTGREVHSVKILGKDEDEDHIECVEWNPDSSLGILAVTAGENIYLISPPVFGFDIENQGRLRVESGFGHSKHGNVKKASLNVDDDSEAEEAGVDGGAATQAKKYASWVKPSDAQQRQGIVLQVVCRKTVKSLAWHRKGDYFVTVQPDSGNSSVLIHQISKHTSQSPFKKSKGIIMDVKFHPFKPQIFVCSQRYIRVYDLAQQVLIKKLMPGARWLSKIDIHPRGDNLIASSFDKRVLWHDLDLAVTPYKTLRYHEKAVRNVQFHKGGLPLFCSASDDGNIHVFHGTVYDDLMTNPLLVPLKKLSGHKVINSLGVLDVQWHPKEAWLFSAGADGVARLWTT